MQAGVIVTTYVSVHAALAQAYNHAQDWTTSASILGDKTRSAQVSPTFVHALPCATVHISTLPAVVKSALGTDQLANVLHAPHSYLKRDQLAVT